MVIGNSTHSVRDYIGEGEITMVNFPQWMAELGIKVLEYNDKYFPSFEDDYLEQVKRSAAAAGAHIACLTCVARLCADDPDEREARVQTIADCLQTAAKLGAPLIRVDLGGTGDAERDATEGIQWAIECFHKLLPMAKQLGVKITIENIGGVSRWADWILQILLSTDPQWVGACPDPGNFPPNVRYRELGKLFPYAFHVHAKSHHFDQAGEETETDFARVIRMLKDVDYQGCISIEFAGPGDQIEAVKKTQALIEKYL